MKLVKRKKPKIIQSVRYNKDKDPENHFREKLMLYTPVVVVGLHRSGSTMGIAS